MSDSFSLQHRKPDGSPSTASHDDRGEAAWDLAPTSEAQGEATVAGAGEAGRVPPPSYGATPDAPANATAMTRLLDDLDDADETEDSPDLMGALDLIGLVRGCWRRRYLIVAIAVTITSLFLVLALTRIEHDWTATAVLIKRDNAEEFTIGDGKSYKPKNYSLSTLLDTLKLPSSLDEVMQRSEIDVSRTSFSAAIGVSIGKESEILQLKTTWKDPKTAALIANNLAEVFLQKSISIQRREAEDSFDYYSARLTEARQNRRLVDAELLAFQSEHNISNFDAETKARLGALANLDGDYQTHKSRVFALTTSLSQLREEIKAQPDMVIKSTIYRSPLQQRQSDYQWELREARSRYTPDNPKVQKLQQKINVLSRMIKDSKDESVPENTYAPNSHRQDLKLIEHERENQLKVAISSAEALRQTIENTERKLDVLNMSEKQYIRLKNRQEASVKLERSLSQRIEESRVQMLRNEAAFDILEPAHPPEQPNPSGRKMVAAGGAVLGMGLGLFVALVLELLNPFIRTLADGRRLAGVDLCAEWGLHEDCAALRSDPGLEPSAASLQLFRRFSNDLEASTEPLEMQSVAVVSAEAGTDTFKVATLLANAFALREKRTLLIDSNFSHPGDEFEDPEKRAAGPGAQTQSPGLIDVLEGRCKLSGALRAGSIKGLHYLASGTAIDPDQANSAPGSRSMRKLIDSLRSLRGQVIYGLAPLSNDEATMEAAAAIGSVILVMRSDHSRRQQIARLVEKLQRRRIRIIAAMVIEVPEQYLEQRPDHAQTKHWWNKLTERAGHGQRTAPEFK